MRVDSVLGDRGVALKQLLLAMDNRLTAVENLAPEGVLGQVLASNGPNTPPSYQSLDGLLTGGVGSVFGRTGDIVAQMGDYQFNQIGAKPTTIGGYGITDAYTKTEVDAIVAALSLDDLDDVVITTPVVKNVLRYNGSEWVNAMLAFSDLTGTPTTLVGYGITDAYTKTEVDALIAAIDFPVDSVFGRTGTVVATAGDYDAFYYTEAEVDALLLLKAPLASPVFTGVPTAPTASLGTNTTQLATTAFVIANAGTGAVSSVFGRTGAVVAVAGDYDAPKLNSGTFQVATFVIPDGGQFTGTASTTNWHPFYIKGSVTGAAWVGALPFFDGVGTRYGYVGKENSANSDIGMRAEVGGLQLAGATGIYATSGLIAGALTGPSAGLWATLGVIGSSRVEIRSQDYTAATLNEIRLVGGPVTFQTDSSVDLMNTSGTTHFSIFRSGTGGITLKSTYVPGAYSFGIQDSSGIYKLLLSEASDLWQMNCGLFWSSDDTYDVGINTASGRPRTIYVGTSVIVGDSNAGIVNVAGAYQKNGIQVLAARRTGWTAATGTATRTSFVTSTVTLPQLAERVKALIDDFIAHGAIGA